MSRLCARWDCMKEFDPKVVNQIYCSPKCSKKSGKESTTKYQNRKKSDKKKLEYLYVRTL